MYHGPKQALTCIHRALSRLFKGVVLLLSNERNMAGCTRPFAYTTPHRSTLSPYPTTLELTGHRNSIATVFALEL